jgi:hypothetical protein
MTTDHLVDDVDQGPAPRTHPRPGDQLTPEQGLKMTSATQARKHGWSQVAERFERVATDEYFGHFAEQALEVALIGMEAEDCAWPSRRRPSKRGHGPGQAEACGCQKVGHGAELRVRGQATGPRDDRRMTLRLLYLMLCNGCGLSPTLKPHAARWWSGTCQIAPRVAPSSAWVASPAARDAATAA